MLAHKQKTESGISLVELVVAVALLSMVSLAAIQLMNMTQKTMVDPQIKLDQQLRSEAIASYIYKDFARGDLDDAIVSRSYTNVDMPEDLRLSGDVTVVSLYGKANRFNGVDPRCPLLEPANPAVGSFQMSATCISRGGQTIVQQMNDLIAKGIVLTTGLQGGIGRCSISQAITVDPATNIATLKVDDPNCLRSGVDRTPAHRLNLTLAHRLNLTPMPTVSLTPMPTVSPIPMPTVSLTLTPTGKPEQSTLFSLTPQKYWPPHGLIPAAWIPTSPPSQPRLNMNI